MINIYVCLAGLSCQHGCGATLCNRDFAISDKERRRKEKDRKGSEKRGDQEEGKQHGKDALVDGTDSAEKTAGASSSAVKAGSGGAPAADGTPIAGGTGGTDDGRTPKPGSLAAAVAAAAAAPAGAVKAAPVEGTADGASADAGIRFPVQADLPRATLLICVILCDSNGAPSCFSIVKSFVVTLAQVVGGILCRALVHAKTSCLHDLQELQEQPLRVGIHHHAEYFQGMICPLYHK